ncbi:MAG: DUF72 domain-containing protein [Saprospiraceae bacterium]|nr:DUF72 domain-containing protein [Pyrinomonadaceae bacterium]
MKFGQVENPEEINFTIPPDHPDTKRVLANSKPKDFKAYVGCAKWNKADLKNFYPKGTKDELGYYSSQFNCIELNATFYRLFPAAQFEKWKETTPDGFKFFPKLGQDISHWGRLKDTEEKVEEFVSRASLLQDKLGVPFLQMHNNFGPKDFDRVKAFVDNWKYDIPLAIEFRKTDWYNDPEVSTELYDLLESKSIVNVLVDTAGRRDLMHMRLTTPTAFVRYVGANHESDYTRLDDWVERISAWRDKGLKELYFFVHQNIEKESPLLSAYFIAKLNKKIGTELSIPKTLN